MSKRAYIEAALSDDTVIAEVVRDRYTDRPAFYTFEIGVKGGDIQSALQRLKEAVERMQAAGVNDDGLNWHNPNLARLAE